LVVALAVGLLIGLERGWKERGDPVGSRVAGFRTFGLIGLAGGLAATLDSGNGIVIAATAIGLAFLLREGFEAQIGATRVVSATTMVAALITFSLGAAAIRTSPLVAASAGVITAFILWLRTPMHRLLDLIEERELSAFLRLLLISIVVLPVVPAEQLGPYGVINPREIWLLVVLISGLGFIGYLGVKFLGERGGVGLLALVGGLASSTAVTLSLAQLSRADREHHTAFAGGTSTAWAVMFVRTVIIVAGIRITLLPSLWVPLGAMFAATVIMALLALLRVPEKAPAQLALPNPLDLKSALIFAAVVAGALVLSRMAQEAWGAGGILGFAALAGTVDADAVTVSMSRLGSEQIADHVAARAIVIATMANTAFKGVMATVAGTGAYGRQVLVMSAVTLAVGLVATFAAIAAGWL